MTKTDDYDHLGILSRLMASNRSKERILQIIQQRKINIDAQDECGNSLLHCAAQRGCILEIELLLELGIYTALGNKDGEIALEILLKNIQSVNSKTIEIVQVLLKCVTVDLEKNCIIDGIDKKLPFGKSFLEYAVESGDVRLAKLLIECGAQEGMNSKNKQGKNLLIQLIEFVGNIVQQVKHDLNLPPSRRIFSTFDFSFIKVLIAKGIDINDHDGCKLTALHQAVSYSFDIKTIKLLLELGADVNAQECDGVTPLHIAASLEGDNKELVNLLVDHGADINAKTITLGYDAIHIAATCNNIESIKVLLERGANIESKDKDQCTVLFTAIKSYLTLHKCGTTNDTSVIKYLINKNANVTAVDINGQTVLFNLGLFNDLTATKLIVNRYIQGNGNKIKEFINKKNKKGFDALDVALEQGNKEFTLFLTSLGADIYNIDSKGRTKLHRAIIDNDTRTINLLLTLGVNVNAHDDSGNTPLHLAVQEASSPKIIKMLLKKGADINFYNHNEATPVDELYYKMREPGNKYNELTGCFIRHMKERYNKDYRYYFQLISTINLAIIAYVLFFAKVLPLFATLTVLFSGAIVLLSCFNQWKKTEQYKIAEHKLTEVTNEKVTIEATNCEKEERKIRLLSKLVCGEKSLGEAQASTAEYSDVFEEHRPASTTKLPSEIEFRKKSIDHNQNFDDIPNQEIEDVVIKNIGQTIQQVGT